MPATEADRVRTRRANAGADASPIAGSAPSAPIPKITAKNSASSSAGNATATLMTEVMARPVRAEPVPGRRSLQQVDDVDGRRLRRPENGREDRQQQDQREQDPRADAERAVQGSPQEPHQLSLMVERGSSSASAMSTMRLTSSTPMP